MEQIRARIDEMVELLPAEKAVSEREAERRASLFLQVMAHITNAMDTLSDEKIETQSLIGVIYAKLLSEDSAKNVTEKKSNVEGHPDYIAAREASEKADSKINFLKQYFKVFEHAHVFYRQMSRPQ